MDLRIEAPDRDLAARLAETVECGVEQAVLRHGARLRCLAVGVETRRDRRPGFAGRLEGRCEWLGSFCVSGEGEDAEQALSRAFHRLEIELAEVLLARQRLLASADERDAA